MRWTEFICVVLVQLLDWKTRLCRDVLCQCSFSFWYSFFLVHYAIAGLSNSVSVWTFVCEIHSVFKTPPPPHHNHFTALFLEPPGWAGARREFLDFMVQGKINRGRHTDHLAGCHSIRTNQCPPPPFPHFLQAGCPSCRPTNSVKAVKATSAFELGRRR